MSKLDWFTLGDEVAALREENARLTGKYNRLVLDRLVPMRVDSETLRAHVAALVEAASLVLLELPPWAYVRVCGSLEKKLTVLRDVIANPDLAALAAATQARETLIRAAFDWEEGAITAHDFYRAVQTYRAALDAAR